MARLWTFFFAAAAIAAFAVVAVVPKKAPATVAAGPDRWWPTYGGSYANTRHVDLATIGPANVASLKLAWKFHTGVSGQFETSPVAIDGVIYATTGADNGVFALDGETGALKWRYVPKVKPAQYVFAVNRGVAVDAGRVFFTTLDDQLIALNAADGKPVWKAIVGDPRDGLSEPAAPLAWNGLVFVGSSGGEFGVRGSYSAYSQKDGRLVWRWWSVGPGWEGKFTETIRGLSLHRDVARERAAAARLGDAWKHGGGAIWLTPALSAGEATIYLSTGNPAPAFSGELRPGDNLYTDCVVALDARTGKMKWYYQETPHDVWDYDAASPPVLFDALDASGRRVPAVGQAGKTGWLYVINRQTGKLIRVSAPFIPQPHLYPELSAAGELVEPGDGGGSVGPIAYDGATHSAFVAGNVLTEIGQTAKPPAWQPGIPDWKGGSMQENSVESTLLSSIDVDSGKIRWNTTLHNLSFGGPLSTNGLVFVGEEVTGTFRAYAATDGKLLWSVNPGNELPQRFGVRELVMHVAYQATRLRHPKSWFNADGDIHAPAIAYRMNGREYILIAASLFERSGRTGGDTVFAFALP